MAKIYIKFDIPIFFEIYFTLESNYSVVAPLSTKYWVFDVHHPAIKARDSRGPVERSLLWRWLCGGRDKPPFPFSDKEGEGGFYIQFIHVM